MKNQSTIKIDPNSPIGRYMIEAAKRKKAIQECIKAGKPLSNLNGIKFATPV